MSRSLKLRRGVVVSEEPLAVEVDGERRPAWADKALLGEMREGDEVVVNVAALDLGLGSGGFDVVHVNLTRGLQGGSEGDEHVIKLNYTSLQHPVEPVEPLLPETPAVRAEGTAAAVPVLVLPLHGHLSPAAWALAQGSSGLRAGYVQSAGGALPGSLSRDVAALRKRGLLAGHVTAGPSYGGEHEAISVAGALAAAGGLGWDVALVGPGPGIIGSATELGHGGMAALDNAHAALALGCPTLVSPRLSSADARERHHGASHHTLTVLSLLLAGVEVPVPAPSDLESPDLGSYGLKSALAEARASLVEAAGERHRLREEPVDLDGYAASGLPTRTMGRGIEEDPLFFAAPLAAGAALRRKG